MVKPLFLLAILANIFYLVSTGSAYASSQSAAVSSASSSESTSQSYAFANAETNQYAQIQETSGKAVACSNSASSTTSTGDQSPVPSCPLNEIWSECPIAVCSPKTCEDVGFAVACPDLRPDGCCPVDPGCICQEGYVRNFAGICVPMTHCPSCGGDPNAQSGCGTNYHKLCSNYKKQHWNYAIGCLYNFCECKPGFVFDEIKRKCVFPFECTYMTCTRKNEVYDPCPALCPFRTCGINDAAISCTPSPFPGDPNCPPPVCRCKDGYYRDHMGECVLWEQCPVCLGLNEMYSPCPAPCPPQRCDVNIALILCAVPPKLGDPECKPGCQCIDDHVRNHSGVCIPRDQCPTCPNPNQVYDPCIAPCPPRRCDVDERLIKCAAPPELGDPSCKAGCRCADGYYTNGNGDCVTKEECPICDGPNEHYACGDPCDNFCATLHKQNQTNCHIKNKRCTDMCYCNEGYARNKKNICIPIEKCHEPRCKGKHETYRECMQGDCRPKYCSQVGFSVPCPRIDPKHCKKGCLCEVGFVRNEYDECIPMDQCPSCGGDCNAKSGCGKNCGRLCSNYKQQGVVCTLECKINGCDCKDGYVHDTNKNKCVLPKDCSQVCKKNEEYSECINGGCTAKNCSQIGRPIPCVKLDPKYCIKGCLCKEGYLREKNGECVPAKDCKPTCPKPNQVYDQCITPCPPRRCDVDERLIKCAPPPPLGDPLCKAGCRCADGYYTNGNGDCVTKEECPICDGPNEHYACGDPCDNFCATLHKQNQTNCHIKNKRCTDMCYCNEGYARNKKNICIPIEKCHEPKCKGKHETYSECMQGDCRPKYCSQVGFSVPCPRIDPKHCKKGCLCKVGFVRNEYDECIPMDQCPSCGGDCNAKSGCGKNCGRLCSNYKQQGVVCTLECKINGCDCKDGYVHDTNKNQCVLPKDCSQVCKKDEVYSECINGGCTAKNCSQIGRPIPCVKLDPKYCIKGCLCKEGYLREENGECVPAKDCKHICNKPNEYYERCDYDCPPRTCESLDKAYVCPIREGDTCKAQCKCEDGYYRNINGDCNTEEQCRMCKDPHEFYACGGACDNVCTDLHKRNQTNCPIVNFKCNEKCYCEKDYARAKNGTCIPIKKCHEHQCDKNERYEKCPAWLCKPQKCSELGYPIPCPDVPAGCKCPVKPACVCVDGYVRGPKGKCIPKKNCPSCGGDPHAESGCGTNCGKKCEDLGKEPGACTELCCDNKCDCKDGYYYDKKLGKCVLPSQCTGICTGKHEVFENCTKPSCRPKKCSELGFPLNCTEPPKCNKGCVCKEGYLRSYRDICIPIKHCPSCKGDKNAESGCGVNCLKKCYDLKNPNNPRPCPKICKVNSCDCKKGYYWDENTGKCVSSKECTPICDKNEVHDPCINGGCSIRNCSQLGRPEICVRPKKCKAGCTCKKGYLRSEDGICIPIKKCPTPTCRKNEVYDSCVNGGCGRRNCSQLNEPILCIDPIECKGGCTCKKGYLRDDYTGVCLPAEKCPDVCNKPNEEFVKCPPICSPQTCESINKTYHCPLIKTKINESDCTGECRCIKGFYRNLNDECISKKECLMCQGEHVYFSCGPACDNVCSDLDTQSKDDCPIKNIKCVPRCYCVNGYARREGADSECVPIEECPAPICDKNEVHDPCINGGCSIRNCSQLGRPEICLRPKKCKAGCTCKKGYLRSEDGICIPIKKCPTPTCRKNEVYDSCVNGGCGRRNCSQLNEPILCIDPIECKGGCTCKKGYLRDDYTGVCLPAEKCPDVCNKPNEEFVKCPPICSPQTCESINKTYHCPLIKTKINESDCTGECRCIKGFYRNLNDECISKKECLMCQGEHVYFSCGPACDNVCSDLDTQSKDDCPIKNIKCVPRCYCVNGYARREGADSECVPIEECPGRGNPTPKPTVNSTVAIAKFNKGNTRLTLALLNQLLDRRPGENLMLSIYSLMNVLAPLVPPSEGDSLDQFLDLMNLDNKEEERTIFPILISRLKDVQDVTYKSANKMYVAISAILNETFKRDSEEIFECEMQNIDFAENVAAAAEINEWVEEQTNDLIKDIAKPEMFSALTRMAIFNCMYFKGDWVHQFNPKSTQLKDFYINGKDTVSLHTMYLRAKLEYALIEDLNAQVLSLPYKGNQFSLLIILPGEDTDLKSVAEKLDPETIDLILKSLELVDVIAHIPRFDIECNIPEMKHLLRENNFTAPLKPNNDFNGIFKNNEEQLYISDIIQKSAFKMDETGSEFAAATGGIISTTSVQLTPEPQTFDWNRPGLCFLLSDNLVLLGVAFVGA